MITRCITGCLSSVDLDNQLHRNITVLMLAGEKEDNNTEHGDGCDGVAGGGVNDMNGMILVIIAVMLLLLTLTATHIHASKR